MEKPCGFHKNLRNYSMCLLMLEAGLRVGEVVRLRVNDLCYGLKPVEFISVDKSIAEKACERRVPVSSKLREAIEALRDRYWFLTERPVTHFAFYVSDVEKGITTRQVERIIQRAGLKALGRAIHPHMLRHTFATRLMRKVDIRTVQTLLGHKTITSTQVYTHPDSDDLVDAISTFD